MDSSVDKYKQFFKNKIGISVEKPSMLTIISLLSLNEILYRQEVKINSIPVDVFLKRTDVVDKHVKEVNFKDFDHQYHALYATIKQQPFYKTVSKKNFRVDYRLYNILSNLGPDHTSLYFTLLSCAKELLEDNDPILYEGLPRPLDFIELSTYKDESLRPYQQNNKREIYRLWTTKQSVMLQMPTGTGKTRLFVSIVNDVCYWARQQKQEVNVLLLAHRKELISQISHNVGVTYRIPHGLIVANNYEQRQYQVQVGSVPTLNVRLDNWKDREFDVIIVDEAHHVKASSYRKILKAFPHAKVLGVTATPCRLNGASFHPEFDDIIVSPSVSKFIKEGYLCDYEYYSIKPDSKLNREIAGIKNFALDGDYLDSAMMEVMDRSQIRANIIDTYLKYAKGKKGIVYTINREHNDHICERFKEAGIAAAAIDSKTAAAERDRLVKAFREGSLDVLCNVNIFSEGFDCPDVEFIQLARPTKSLSLYLQQVGRGLRTAPGKDKVLFLDNVGLYNRFGFPSARRHWRHHFEGWYEKEKDDRISCFSIDEVEGKELNFIDDYQEGNENVDLLHTSEIEDPIQIDEFGYIKDFNKYIIRQLSKQKTVSEKKSVLDKNLSELLNEENIFKKYRIEIPEDIKERICQVQKEIDDLNKEARVIDCISNIDWRTALNEVPSPYNGKSIRGVLNTLVHHGYHIHVVRDKSANFTVSIEEQPYDSQSFRQSATIKTDPAKLEWEDDKIRKLDFSCRHTLQMIRCGHTDIEIARFSRLSLVDVVNQICKFIEIGLVNADDMVDSEISTQIKNYVDQNETTDVDSIYLGFNKTIMRSEIQYVLAGMNKDLE